MTHTLFQCVMRGVIWAGATLGLLPSAGVQSPLNSCSALLGAISSQPDPTTTTTPSHSYHSMVWFPQAVKTR